jgi:hypothetical protein
MSNRTAHRTINKPDSKRARQLAAGLGIVIVGFLLVFAVGAHAEFLQSAGLVPSGSDNWFSGMTTAVKDADSEMSLAAVAMTPIAASVIGWAHYAGSQQSHKHAGRALVGLVVLLAVAPHIAS